jgi:hypothetical protein
MSEAGLDSPSVSHTYETTKAREKILRQPDKIIWDHQYAYRNSPYRFLHHQKGVIGSVNVRLLQASNLQRSYWSALAMIPGVKHLGISKAHGEISSYAQISLQSDSSECLTSPVVPFNNAPKWNNCEGTLTLRKGCLKDGQSVKLFIQCVEEASGVERKMGALPLLPSQDDRVLGMAELDISSVLLGESSIMDVWVDIYKDPRKRAEDGTATTPGVASLHGMEDEEDSVGKASLYQVDDRKPAASAKGDMPKMTGRVRLLVTYRPNGMAPQPHDLVALECFARRHPRSSSCTPLLPPLSPMRVLQVHDAFVLVEYRLKFGCGKATMRLPRTAVFVIERTNLIDGALNLALFPTDFFFSTPVGHGVAELTGPLVGAVTELSMPALLSAKLLWTAVRTTTFAGMSGVGAATNAILQSSKAAAHDRHQQQSFHAKKSGGHQQQQQQYVSL